MNEKMQKPRQTQLRPVVLVFSTSYFPFVGGAEVAVREIAKKLSDKFDFFIITSRFKKELSKLEQVPEGTIVRLGFGSILDKYILPIYGFFWAVRRPGILFGLDISTGSFASALLKFFQPQRFFILNIQYGYGDDRLKYGRFGGLNAAFRFMLQEADYVTTISNYLLRTARKYGYKGKADIIPNGIDLKNFKFFNFQKKQKTIITISRLVHKNGIDILIEAIAKVKEKVPDLKCLILGEGPEEKSLKSLAMRLNVSGNVEFVGNIVQEKIPEYLAVADIFVRPSRSEGLGISFLEAMAAGVPVIATPVGGIPDFLKDRETGVFCNLADPQNLAEKILLLFGDESLVQKIVENGRKMVEENFLWDEISKKYESLFNSIYNTKVLIATGIFPPDIGGPATYSKILLGELPKNGTHVKVLSFSSVRHLPKIIRHIVYGLKLMVYSRKVDIIFAQDPVSVGLPAAIAAKLLRKKFLLKVVGDYAWEQWQQSISGQGARDKFVTPDDFQKEKFDFLTELRRQVQKYVASRAKLVIVPSNYLKKIVGMWGINQNKIMVIYNSFDESMPRVSKEEARKILNLSGKVMVSAGRLVPWKGFDVLIEVFNKLSKKFEDLKLIIIGSGPEEKKLELQTIDYGLQTKIVFTGSLPREKVLEYLSASDVFVLNTAYEGFSHQILEVMALGVPVVTTNIGGNPEILRNGENGFLVEYNNKEALREKVTELLENKNLAESFSAKAQISAQQFTKERMIRDVLVVLKIV